MRYGAVHVKIKIVKCGIMSPENYIQRTRAIARGEYKPQRGEPKIWFESLQTMAQVLDRIESKIELIRYHR